MKLWSTALCAAFLFLVAATPGWASRIYFNAAAGEEVNNTAKCSRVVRSSSAGVGHKFVVLDCPNTGGKAVFHFNAPPDFPGPNNVKVKVYAANTTGGTGAAVFTASMTCFSPPGTANPVDYATLDDPRTSSCVGNGNPWACCIGSGQGNCDTGDMSMTVGAVDYVVESNLSTAAIVPHVVGTYEEGAPCALVLTRSSTDPYTGSVGVVAVELQY